MGVVCVGVGMQVYVCVWCVGICVCVVHVCVFGECVCGVCVCLVSVCGGG